MKVTAYFREQVLRKRPYLKVSWCEEIIKNPLAKKIQGDGRIRFWGKIGAHYLRVITLGDGKTIHNAFFDRDFKFEGGVS